MKLRNSLLVKYLAIIFIALIIIPFSFPIVTIFLFQFDKQEPNVYQNGSDMEELWHSEARQLEGASAQEIEKKLTELHQTYQETNMFWVTHEGDAAFTIPKNLSIPKKWTPSYTVEFMKKSHGILADPFTVVAFVGEQQNEGFIVIQIPRSFMVSTGEILQERYDFAIIGGTIAILVIFIFVSWVFFYKIRKRLVRVQKAMTSHEKSGIPEPVKIEKQDEIGQLEEAFNQMIYALESSRKREKEEEELRRQLIANLSHDLRTPLTAIRSHAYSLKKEDLTARGRESVELIDYKIDYLAQLIENLLSYTLLSSGKYPFNPKQTDITRMVRTSIANWYLLFENEGFHIDIDLPNDQILWQVDQQWFERILDNLFQNVIRHAKTGKYLAVQIKRRNGKDQIVIADRGGGMNKESTDKGVGIGMSIVALMLKEMQLDWSIDSNEHGTTITIGADLS